MNIGDIRQLYRDQLASIYSEREIDVLFKIFAESAGISGQKVTLHREMPLDDCTTEKLLLSLEQLCAGKPYQHVLGETPFLGLTLEVNQHVLIPRPETEELADIIIKQLNQQSPKNTPLKVLDIGTGSGALAIAIAKNTDSSVEALDVSAEALEVAERNARRHAVNVNFLHIDYLASELTSLYDVIISNPPYIGTDEAENIDPLVHEQEPALALYAPKNDVLAFYRKIAADAARILHPEGMIFLEINQKYGRETAALFGDGFLTELRKDLSGNDRFVIAKRKA